MVKFMEKLYGPVMTETAEDTGKGWSTGKAGLPQLVRKPRSLASACRQGSCAQNPDTVSRAKAPVAVC